MMFCQISYCESSMANQCNKQQFIKNMIQKHLYFYIIQKQFKIQMSEAQSLQNLNQIAVELANLTNEQVKNRIRIFDNNVKQYKLELGKINNDTKKVQQQIQDNRNKIKQNKQLPWLVSNVVQILDIEPQLDEDDAQQKADDKCIVVKTSTRNTVFLPIPGLVDSSQLKPGELVGVNKDSYILLQKLPAEYDSRVRAMEVEERPSEEYTDIGGLDKQIEQLREAIVLPITHKEKFQNIGIRPPKGCLMFGPPGTGKTMMARACAGQTKATFLKLAGSSLVQMYIGDGPKMVRDAFALAKEKAPTIIFIDEIDAVGTKRFDNDKSGDRQVQRTMLQLLNHLDGFSPNDDIKVICATNRPDVLDPALMRSGRLDRKIQFPLPNEDSRVQILKIHSRKMVHKQVNFVELARSTQDFNGAQLKAVCVQAGMNTLRRGGTFLHHEDYIQGIAQVQSKKKSHLNYYA